MSETVPVRVELTLISHTNTGKTTLARTLLARDVGDVRDAVHVTVESASYPMISTDAGDTLVLTDTPGFADSARLARRLAQQGNPIGWFLSQVWDRWRDRPLWLAQQAVRSVRDAADVVLYLVNAIESPEDAGYLAPELEVLAWIGKPTVLLLNQTGEPRSAADDAADVGRWRDAVRDHPLVRDVLALDAFARCWPQEMLLLRAIAPLLADDKREGFARLASAWQSRRLDAFDASMAALAVPLARAAIDREAVDGSGLAQAARDLVRAVAGRKDANGAQAAAMRALSSRLEREIRDATDRVIALHGLEGRAVNALLARLAASVTADAGLPEGTSALVGGIVSGALSGLAADLAAGGLTLGAGVVAGTVLGALGGATLARGYNVARGRTGTVVRWSGPFLEGVAGALVLRYLAVAHFGRGRGAWTEPEYPAFWRTAVAAAVEGHRAALAAAMSEGGEDADALAHRLTPVLAAIAMDVLRALYPAAFDRAEPDDASSV